MATGRELRRHSLWSPFGPPSQTPLLPQAAAASTLERPIPHLQLRSAVSMWCRFPAKTSPFSIASELHFLQLASSFLQLRRESLNCTRSGRSEEHTSELQSLMRISYAVFCLKKKKNKQHTIAESRNTYNKTRNQ